MDFLLVILSLVMGLVIGSFLGAFTYRWGKGLSVADGRSFCPHCKAKISWLDNVPVVSYLLLKGKCRSCGNKISLRYPAIELSTALLFGLLGYFYLIEGPQSTNTLFLFWSKALGPLFLPTLFFVVSCLIAIFVIDLENQLIPDSLVFILFVLAFLGLILTYGKSPFAHLAAGFSVSLFLLLIGLFTRGKGMGMGDVKLALAAGTILGWPHALTWLFASFVLGGAAGLLLVLSKKASFGKHIPFGPFLVVSFFVVVVFGDNFLKWLGI